jgi:hypothetical protein
MSDIFNEINEDLRRDSAKRFWQRYGVYVIILAVLVVVGTAGWRLYEGWQASEAAAAGDAYMEAIRVAEAGDHAGAATLLTELAASSPGDYPMLARFRAATETAAAGDPAGALAAFDALAADTSVPAEYRDLARIRGAQIALDLEDAAAIEARVAALQTNPGPWRFAALEIAAIAAVRAEDWEGARALLDQILQDPETPSDVGRRADMLMDLVIGAVGAVEPAPEAAP